MPENEKFVNDVIAFYKAFLGSVATSIEDLAKIQTAHKTGYDRLKELQTDPTKLLEKFDDMAEEQRANLMYFFLKAAAFEERLITLFKLSSSEQKQLAKDLRTFLESSLKTVEKDKK